MAERRMFCKSIIESDQFMDMPADAQMLYIHLSMASDDDGFCDNPRAIMRQCGASDDSMKILRAKKFILTFDKNDGFVVVIKHWRMNNYIRKDTYHETKYKEFMKELYYDENQSYSMNPGDGHIPVVPDISTHAVSLPSQTRDEPVTDPSRTRDDPLTQVSIGKDSKEKEKESIGNYINKGPTPERIDMFKHMLERFRSLGRRLDGVYSLAEGEGITREMLEGA